MIEGIDVSKYQPTVDWARVAKAGIKFVIARASVGIGSPDSKFESHVAGAKAAGLLVGAYHYLMVRHGKPQDAAAQADEFCDRFLKAGCNIRPALDCEPTNNAGCTAEEWLEAIRLWVERVRERLGCEPILYTYPGFWAGLGKAAAADPFVAGLDLWIAHYRLGHPDVPAPWKTWMMWQYAADAGVIGQVDGVPGHVDRDVLAGDISLLSMSSKPPEDEPPPPAPPEPPSQVTQDNSQAPPKPELPPAEGGWLAQVLRLIMSMMSKAQGRR